MSGQEFQSFIDVNKSFKDFEELIELQFEIYSILDSQDTGVQNKLKDKWTESFKLIEKIKLRTAIIEMLKYDDISTTGIPKMFFNMYKLLNDGNTNDK